MSSVCGSKELAIHLLIKTTLMALLSIQLTYCIIDTIFTIMILDRNLHFRYLLIVFSGFNG